MFFIFLFNRDITTFLRLLLRKEGFNFHSSSEMEIVRTIKEVRPNTVAMVFIRRVRVKESCSIIIFIIIIIEIICVQWSLIREDLNARSSKKVIIIILFLMIRHCNNNFMLSVGHQLEEY